MNEEHGALHSWCEDVCVECVDREDFVGCSSGVINFCCFGKMSVTRRKTDTCTITVVS